MSIARMVPLFAVLVALAACSDSPCPSGSTKVGDRCVPVDDAGVDASVDAGSEDACTLATFYEDGDGDGFGDDASPIEACGPRAGIAAVAGDCDDEDVTVKPGATDSCNGVDDDCDGATDEGHLVRRGTAVTIATEGDAPAFATSNSLASVAAFDFGYAIVWIDEDEDLSRRIVDASGAMVGLPWATAGTTPASEQSPRVQRLETSAGSWILASWGTGQLTYSARRVDAMASDLDGPLTDSSDRGFAGHALVDRAGSAFVAAWSSDHMGGALWARLTPVPMVTATAAGTMLMAGERTAPLVPRARSAFAMVDAPSPQVWGATAIRRGTDPTQFAYLVRAGAEGAVTTLLDPVKLEPSAGEAVRSLTMARLPRANAAAFDRVAVALSTRAGVDRHLWVGAIEAAALGSPITLPEWTDLGPVDVYVMRATTNGLELLGLRESGEMQEVVLRQLDATTLLPTTDWVVLTSTSSEVYDVDFDRRTSREGVALITTETGTMAARQYTVAMQPFGCE